MVNEDDIDSIIDSVQQDELRDSMTVATKRQPDAEAKFQALSKRTGLPVDVIRLRTPEAEQQARMGEMDWEKVARDTPTLAGFLSDPANASVTHDDVDALASVERWIKGSGYALATGATVSVGAGLMDLSAMPADVLSVVTPGDLFSNIATDLRYRAQRAREATEAFRPVAQSSTERAVMSGFQSAGQNLALFPMGFARAAAGAAQAGQALAGGMSTLVGAEAYGEARRRGMGIGQSAGYAVPQAMIEYSMERVPAGKLFGSLAARSGFFKTFAEQAVWEVGTEQITTVMQDLNDWINLNPDKTLKDYIAARPEAAYQTLIATLVGTAVQTGAATGVQAIADRAAGRYDAEQTRRASERLQKALQLAGQTKTIGRAPSTLQDFVGRLTTDSVYVDADVLAQSAAQLPPGQFEKVLPTAAEQLRNATPGSTIAIPAAEIIANVPGTALEETIIQNGRTDPDAPSLAEVGEAGKLAEEFKAEADRILAEVEDADTWQKSVDTVKQTVLDQIVATGRRTPDAAEAEASLASSFYAVQASRLGTTPDALYAKYPLRFAGQGGEGAGILSQPRDTRWPDLTELLDRWENNDTTPLEMLDNVEFLLDDGRAPEWMRDIVDGYRSEVEADTRELGGRGDVASYEDEFIAALEKAAQEKSGSNVLNQSAAASIITGEKLYTPITTALKLTPAETASTAIEWMTGYGGDFTFHVPDKIGGIPEIVRFLQERRLGTGLAVLDISKDADRQELAHLLAAEALAEMQNAGSALEWYDTTIRKMLAMLSIKFPELQSDQRAQTALFLATAISSQGLNPENNLRFAIKQYDAYRKTVDENGIGQFPVQGMGESSGVMADQFSKINDLMREMGPDLLARFLATPMTKRQLAEAGFDIGGELMDEMLLGSSILGPKIGFGFYSNLTGNFEPVTMDMWFMRTIGRLAGTLPDFEPGKFAGQVERFRRALSEKGKKKDGIFAAEFDKNQVKQAKTDDAAMLALARAVKSAHERDYRNNRAKFDSGTRQKTELVKAAESIIQSMDKPRDAPTSGGERRLLRDVVRRTVDLVSTYAGRRVPPASLQALLWYPEQELYYELGAKLAVTSQDYAGAARKALAEEGVDEGQLEAAARSATEPGSGAVQPGTAGNVPGAMGQGTQGTGRASPLAPDELSRFIAERNARLIAEQRKEQSRVIFEVAPDPTSGDLVTQWRNLPADTRLQISQRVADQIVPKVLRTLKVHGAILPQVGSYGEDTNPSFILFLEDGDPMEVAKAIGHALAQEEMMVVAPQPFAGGDSRGALWIDIGEKSVAEIDQIYQTLHALERPDGSKIIGGQSTSNGQMVLMLDAQDNVDEVGALVAGALNGEYPVVGHDVFAAFPQKQDYGYDIPQSDTGGDQGQVRGRIDNARAEATRLVGKELRAASKAGETGKALTQPGEKAPRATFDPEKLLVTLQEGADLSSALHEFGHAFLEILADMASQPGAPAEVVQDMDTILKWFKIPDLATWNGMTLDQKRASHEKLAEGFEQYLFEGKAPSAELQPLFRRFRSWLVSVYRSLQTFLKGRNIELSDEIRGVFDRMLATEDQIKAAERAAGLTGNDEATNQAIEQLTARSLRDMAWLENAKSRIIRGLQKDAAAKRKAVQAEVKAEVMASPIEQARKILRETKASELNGEMIAQQLGFTSADHMAQVLTFAPSAQEAIKALTDQRMLERYGDISSPEMMELAAQEAVHNEARARAIATELAGQQKGVGKVRVLLEAAKQFASNVVASKRVADLKRSARIHIVAEQKAAAKWAKATKKADTVDAIQAKRDQLLNHVIAGELVKAQQEMNKLLRYLKKFDSAGVRKKIDQDYLDQIDKMLERVDLRKSTSMAAVARRQSLNDWVAQQQAAGLDPQIPKYLLEDAKLTSYKELTVEQMRGLADSIKQIEHFGRLKNKLLTAKDRREFQAAVDEIAKSIVEHGGEAKPLGLEPISSIRMKGREFWADHRKFRSLIRQWDGNQDNGPLWRFLGKGMDERNADEAIRLASATDSLANFMQPILDMKGGFDGGHVYIRSMQQSFTRGMRIATLLNWGNETNRQRLMQPNTGIDEEAMREIASKMSPEELRFVNQIWEYLDTFWPEIAAKQKRVFGVAPEKVESSPFSVTVNDGSVVDMRGGYYPLKYDSNRSDRSSALEAAQIAEELKKGAFTRRTTRRGHTEERLENVTLPVRLDLMVITQHINEVVHDLVWHEWLIDANRLMSAPQITAAIRDYYGPEYLRVVKDTLQGIAGSDIQPQHSGDAVLLWMRKNVSRSVMGLSMTTAMLQPFGVMQSVVRIGYKPVARGLSRWAGDISQNESTMQWIAQKSPMMRLRAQTMNREIVEITGRLKGKSKTAEIVDATLFVMMRKMQLVADIPTWLGQYEKTLEETGDEEISIAQADRAVLDAQGGGQQADLSPHQRHAPVFMMFSSYFNTTLNLSIEQTAATDFKNPRAVVGWLSDMAMLWVLPAIVPTMITVAMQGGGDDEDWWKKLAQAQVSYALSSVLWVREAAGALSGFDYAGPPVFRVISDLYKTVQQVGQGEMDEAAVIAAGRLFGDIFGLPMTQVIRSYRGWKAWDEGDAPPTAILFGPPPKQ